MCGIAGITYFDGRRVENGRLKAMTDVLAHRGPDGEGMWISEGKDVGLGHRRLSIIDLSRAGAQPMHYLDRYTVTFNGEIYNYVELKMQLEKLGLSIRTKTDTEVLLAAYHYYGQDMLKHLDGMFAFSIYDKNDKTLFCARDRFGEKPLFYQYNQGKQFLFASEIKSLFAAGIHCEVNQKMLFNYLSYNVVENARDKSETFYVGITRLEAAHSLFIDASGQMSIKKYWDVNLDKINHKITEGEAIDKFQSLFKDSVNKRLRADVPVGSSLSGGLDSSSIVLQMSESNNTEEFNQNTFSARFHNKKFDEGKYIESVVKKAKVKAHYTWPDENEMLDQLDQLYYHQEEPFVSSSVFAQWEVMKLAKEQNVTVLLDGQGADETLAGYLHYFRPYFIELYNTKKSDYHLAVKQYKELHGRDFKMTPRLMLEAKLPGVMRSLGKLHRQYSTPEYLKGFHPDYARQFKNEEVPFRNDYNSLNEVLKFYSLNAGLEKLLRFSDRNSMAFSREVRLPFLSHHFVEFLFTLPTHFKINSGWTKYILRKSMEDILPQEICWRVDKLGFQPPQDDWMKNKKVVDLVASARTFLLSEGIVKQDSSFTDWQCIMAYKLLKMDFKSASSQ